MSNYTFQQYQVGTGLAPASAVGSIAERVPAYQGASVAALDRGTLAPMGLAFDQVLSTVTYVVEAFSTKVFRSVTLRKTANAYVNGAELWPDVGAGLGSWNQVEFATVNLFGGDLAMRCGSSVKAVY